VVGESVDGGGVEAAAVVEDDLCQWVAGPVAQGDGDGGDAGAIASAAAVGGVVAASADGEAAVAGLLQLQLLGGDAVAEDETVVAAAVADVESDADPLS